MEGVGGDGALTHHSFAAGEGHVQPVGGHVAHLIAVRDLVPAVQLLQEGDDAVVGAKVRMLELVLAWLRRRRASAVTVPVPMEAMAMPVVMTNARPVMAATLISPFLLCMGFSLLLVWLFSRQGTHQPDGAHVDGRE